MFINTNQAKKFHFLFNSSKIKDTCNDKFVSLCVKPMLFYIFAFNMSKLKEIYNESKNGIIITLVFHIIVFIILNIGQFRIKKEFTEDELIIDFPVEDFETQPPSQELNTKEQIHQTNNRATNIASNRSANNEQKQLDQAILDEIERARELLKDVSRQLSKDIPTIDDLKMPEKTSEGLDRDSLLKNLYSGESNVEYSLENRYHVRLPIPVYLSQYGGLVRVIIIVDNKGNVISAEPQTENNLPEQLLSYAKTAALRTKFNAAENAPLKQSGYIQYKFIAQ